MNRRNRSEKKVVQPDRDGRAARVRTLDGGAAADVRRAPGGICAVLVQ